MISSAVPLVRAELLKLRRLRGTTAVAGLLSVGSVALYLLAVIARDSPQRGGSAGLLNGATLVGLYFGAFVATMMGAEAGTLDLGSGVFRELVATGCSRTTLALVRIPAAVAVALAVNLGALALAAAAAVVLHGTTATPALALILQTAGWVTLSTTTITCLSLGVASITGSRSITLTAVIAWQTAATSLLYATPALGRLREGLLMVALSRLRPGPSTGSPDHPGSLNAIPGFVLPMPAVTACVVVLAWTTIPLALGVWRTRRLEP